MDRGGLPLVNHLLQYTLRSLCGDSQWVYAVFWRILPRNYPPPKWDTENGFLDRSKGNKRNWILVWEDGFCDFFACTRDAKGSTCGKNTEGFEEEQANLLPEVFFKMSHEIYNYGEGLIGKVAADNSHKWIYRDPPEHEIAFLSPWQGSLDPHPRTWEAQFKAGIQTIAVVAVGEGLLQLGSAKKIMEDLNFVILLQRKFNYLQSIPGVFAPHPMPELAFKSSSLPGDSSLLDEKTLTGNGVSIVSDHSLAHSLLLTAHGGKQVNSENQLTGAKRPIDQSDVALPLRHKLPSPLIIGSQRDLYAASNRLLPPEMLPSFKNTTDKIVSQNGSPHLIPSMSSLQALLSKLPSVTYPPPPPPPLECNKRSTMPQQFSGSVPGLPRGGMLAPSKPAPQSGSSPTDNTTKCCADINEPARRFNDPQPPAILERKRFDGIGEHHGSPKLAEKEKQAGSTMETFDNISEFTQISDELGSGDTYTSLFREMISTD